MLTERASAYPPIPRTSNSIYGSGLDRRRCRSPIRTSRASTKHEGKLQKSIPAPSTCPPKRSATVFGNRKVGTWDCGGNPGPKEDREDHTDVQRRAKGEGPAALQAAGPSHVFNQMLPCRTWDAASMGNVLIGQRITEDAHARIARIGQRKLGERRGDREHRHRRRRADRLRHLQARLPQPLRRTSTATT